MGEMAQDQVLVDQRKRMSQRIAAFMKDPAHHARRDGNKIPMTEVAQAAHIAARVAEVREFHLCPQCAGTLTLRLGRDVDPLAPPAANVQWCAACHFWSL